MAEVKLHGVDYTIKDGAPPRTRIWPYYGLDLGDGMGLCSEPRIRPASRCAECRYRYFLFGIGIFIGLVGPRSLSAVVAG